MRCGLALEMRSTRRTQNCNDSRRAVTTAKDAWFQCKLWKQREGDTVGSLYGNVFVTFKEEEMVLPMRSAVVKDENGHVCTTTESQHRQRRHFNNILNVQSGFDMEELERVTQRQLKPEMAELPTEDELLNAIEKVKNGRAGGESSILPEMVKAACIGYTFSKTLLELVHDVWEKRSVPDDWRDAMLIPIPKKGDLSHCDNWGEFHC